MSNLNGTRLRIEVVSLNRYMRRFQKHEYSTTRNCPQKTGLAAYSTSSHMWLRSSHRMIKMNRTYLEAALPDADPLKCFAPLLYACFLFSHKSLIP